MDDLMRSEKFLEMQLPGASPAAKFLRYQIARLNHAEKTNRRPLGQPVLLEGETGAGKEFIARVLCAHWIWLTSPKARQDSYLAGAPEAIQQLKSDMDK